MPAPASSGRAARIGLVALLIFAAAMAVAPITTNDVFLHLTTGRLVVETGRVPHTDDYSALARGRPFVAHEWLSGVLLHLVHAAAGFNGLVLFKMVLAAAITLALYAAARTAGAAPAAALPGLALVMLLAGARLLERPHLFTYLMTALFLLHLARHRAGRRAPPWILVLLQVLWANLHGGFVLGPLLVTLAAAAAAFERRLHAAARLAILAPVLVAACLLNPYGAALLRFPFELTGSAFMDLIYEWLPPTTEPFASTLMARLYVVWGVTGLAVLAAAAARRLRGREALPAGTFPFLVFAAFLPLSLRMNRNVTDFALATFPGVAATATGLLRAGGGDDGAAPGRGAGAGRLLQRLLPAWAPIFVLGAAWMALSGYPYAPGSRREPGWGLGRNIPRAAVDYLEAHDIAGNLFNDYASGGYLVFRLHPRARVAMDSRNDVYGEALYLEYTRALRDPEALRALLQRLEAAAIVLQWPHPGMVTAAATVRRLRGWRPVYFDDAAVVYLEAGGPHHGLAADERYELLEPALFRAGTLSMSDAPRALAEAQRAVRQSGGAWIARVMRADALLAAGRSAEALTEEARLAAEDPPLAHLHIQLGLLRLAAGDPWTAAGRFRRALELNPRSPFARDALERATSEARAPRPGGR